MEKISIREFGRRLGMAESGIRKMIKDGFFSDDAVDFSNPIRPKIIPAVAVIEWIEGVDISATRSKVLVDLFDRYQSGEDITKIVCRGDNEEVEKVAPKKKKATPKKKTPAKDVKTAPKKEPIEDTPPPSTAHRVQKPEGKTLSDIKKEQAEVKLAESKILLKRTMGKLVDKDTVYKELYGFGTEVRNAMLAIPDRIIDELLSCSNRNEAHSLLHSTINESLEILSDIHNRN
jgi:hypothetical protein